MRVITVTGAVTLQVTASGAPLSGAVAVVSSGAPGVQTGAAMAVAYDARRSTADVDAIFAPPAEVRAAAGRVAEHLGLATTWLNDGAKAFMPGDDPDRIVVFERPNLQVAAASPRYLLAMKLLAARVERDQDDIRILYNLCGFSTAEQGLAVVEAAYPSYVIPARTRLMLEEMFPSHDHERDRGHDHGDDDLELGR